MVMNKKAISPVVATALLLVVAVVAVVGFQTWFASYQSGVETQVEGEADSAAQVGVHRVEANETHSYGHAEGLNVYVTTGDNDLVDEDIRVTGERLDCNDDEISGDMLVFSNCEPQSEDGWAGSEGEPEISPGDEVEVMIETEDEVWTFSELVEGGY